MVIQTREIVGLSRAGERLLSSVFRLAFRWLVWGF